MHADEHGWILGKSICVHLCVRGTSVVNGFFVSSILFSVVPCWAMQPQVPTQTPTAVSMKLPLPVKKPTLKRAPRATPTFTATAAPTSTSTSLDTPTITPSPTATPTFSMTPTNAQTATATITSTPGVFQFFVSPKPDAEGNLHFKWGTNIPAEQVFVKVFSNGFRIVFGLEFNKGQQPEFLTAGEHETVWDGKDEEKRRMPPGNYLCFIEVRAGGKSYEASGKTDIP